MTDPVSNAVMSGAGKVASNLITPEANNTPRQDLTKASDQAAFKRGEATAGQNTTIEGVVESLETIAKLYMNASPEMKTKYLKEVQDLITKAALSNVTLRELKEKGKYEIFQKREDGYQSAQYAAQQHWYNEQLAIRRQATGGITGMTSLKGTIATIAFMINDFMGGSLGDMPLMKKWKAEAEAFKVNMDDIKRPERVDLNFKDQPNALISNADMQREVNELTSLLRSSAAVKAADGLATGVKPTVDNPSPLLQTGAGAGAASKKAIAENADDATRAAPKPAGAASAAMFATPAVAEEADKAIKKAQASSRGATAAKMFADPALEPK